MLPASLPPDTPGTRAMRRDIEFPEVLMPVDLSVFDGHLDGFRESLKLFSKHLRRNRAVMNPHVYHQLETLALAIDDGITGCECEMGDCPKLGTHVRRSGAYCQEHDEKWLVCEACKDDVLAAEAYTDDEGRTFHALCLGPLDQAVGE